MLLQTRQPALVRVLWEDSAEFSWEGKILGSGFSVLVVICAWLGVPTTALAASQPECSPDTGGQSVIYSQRRHVHFFRPFIKRKASYFPSVELSVLVYRSSLYTFCSYLDKLFPRDFWTIRWGLILFSSYHGIYSSRLSVIFPALLILILIPSTITFTRSFSFFNLLSLITSLLLHTQANSAVNSS